MPNQRLIIPLLILVTVAAFLPAASCKFIEYDDPAYVTDNPHVLQGLSLDNIAWAFTTSHMGFYQPVTWLSLMLDSSLMGDSPRGYHVTNIVLHGLAVVLLYLALEALTGAAWRSALVALCFAIHPLRVESVVWITERKDVLSGCFGFAALLAYAAYAHRPSWGRYLGVAILFVLGLLAKPILVTLPCLFLLLDIWPLRRVQGLTLPAPSAQAPVCPARRFQRLVVEKTPWLGLSAASAVVTSLFQHQHQAMADLGGLPLSIRLPHVLVSYVRYLGKMVWFRGLILPYPLRTEETWAAVLAGVALTLITASLLIRFRRDPHLVIGWFWYLGMLVPVIGLVQVGKQGIADRFTYLPTIGLLIMAAWSVPEWFSEPWPRGAWLAGVTIAISACLAGFTWRQIGYWHDSLTLFAHAVEYSPDSALTLDNLGNAYYWNGQPLRALPYFRHAVDVSPNDAQAQTSLGILLSQLAQEHHDTVMVGDGMAHLRLATQCDPDNVIAHYNLANTLAAQKQYSDALREFQEALRVDPLDDQSNYMAGNMLMAMGRAQDALPYYKQAAHLRPDIPPVCNALARALVRLHRPQEAEAWSQRAVQMDPNNAEYQSTLAQAQAGRTLDAGTAQATSRSAPLAH